MSDEKDNNLIASLTEREKKVLKEKFGLEKLDQKSLEEVGEKFEVTRKRIREIEEKALKKLNPNKDPNNDGPNVA